MSDLCLYELEDNVWDEFSGSDDHIVPHPGDAYDDQYVQNDSRKKQRQDVVGVSSSVSDVVSCGSQRKEDNSLSTPSKGDLMLEKGSWSRTPDGVFPAAPDAGSANEVTTASEDTKMLSQHLKTGNAGSACSEFCADHPILVETCPADDGNAYNYPLSNISQTESDLNFFTNDHDNKESSDLLYYGWPDDIGNFDDVDRMFRSCDSTFGLESLNNEDELCWFSSSRSAEGSEDALKLGSKFPISEASALNSELEHHEASRLNTAVPAVNDSNNTSLLGDKPSSRSAGVVDHSSVTHAPLLTGADAKSTNWHRRRQNQSEGKRKDRVLENGSSFRTNGNLKQFADPKHSFTDSSSQVFSGQGFHLNRQNIGPDSVTCLQTHASYVNTDYTNSSDQVSFCPTQSGSKSESNGYPSSSPMESSFASNPVQSTENTRGPAFEIPAITTTSKIYCSQDLQPVFFGNSKHADMTDPAVFYDPVLVQKHAHNSEYETEGHSEMEGHSMGIPKELDSSNAPQSSCMSSALDEISLEATSFRQLQQVMGQLDIRTKLCIRDSLYRLARSAEQRHNCVNSNGGERDDRGRSGAPMTQVTDKGTGYMDMETDTNPIDRSIAHLLFHRPSDASVVSAADAFS